MSYFCDQIIEYKKRKYKKRKYKKIVRLVMAYDCYKNVEKIGEIKVNCCRPVTCPSLLPSVYYYNDKIYIKTLTNELRIYQLNGVIDKWSYLWNIYGFFIIILFGIV